MNFTVLDSWFYRFEKGLTTACQEATAVSWRSPVTSVGDLQKLNILWSHRLLLMIPRVPGWVIPRSFSITHITVQKNQINQSVLVLNSWHLCDKKYWRIRDTGLGCLCWDSVRFDILPFLIILTLLSWPIMAILESLRQQIYLYTVCHSTRKFPITAEHDWHAETGDICFCLSKQKCQKNIQRW